MIKLLLFIIIHACESPRDVLNSSAVDVINMYVKCILYVFYEHIITRMRARLQNISE